eukprot:gene26135-11855_t
MTLERFQRGNSAPRVSRYPLCFEEETAEACAPRWGNLSLLVWVPLTGSTLTGKCRGGKHPGKARHALFPAFQARYHTSLTQDAVEEYCKLADSKGMSITQMSLQWCASRWYMGSVIIGATTVEQLKEDFDAFETPSLDEEALKAIDETQMRRRNPMHHD